MTKLERAKKQTLKKWKCHLYDTIDRKPYEFQQCGYCAEYLEPNWTNSCYLCPLMIANNNVSCDGLNKKGIHVNGWYHHSYYQSIPDCLAVLIYIHQF
jgi:hypothetical protein